MRLYRGLKEPYRPEQVGASHLSGTDFTDCPYTALLYAQGRRSVVLVVDVPDDVSRSVSEELWLNRNAKRFMIWGRFENLIVAMIPAKDLRSQVRKKGVSNQSFEYKAALLRHYIDRQMDSHLFLPPSSRPHYVSPHTAAEDGWEKRSSNGEVWIDGHNTATTAVADHLLWVVREYSSRARRVHRACGALPFTLGARHTPPTIALSFMSWFDLALIDRELIAARIQQRGGHVDAGSCPPYWLEGEGFVLAADAHEVGVRPGDTAEAKERWKAATDTIAGIAPDNLVPALAGTESSCLAAILVAVHEDPIPSSRPSREECVERHHSLLAELRPQASGMRITWNVLWRLPPGLKVPVPGRAPWLRFPAVSFVAAVRVLWRGEA